MKATRKKEYEERRRRKATAHEISEIKVAEWHEKQSKKQSKWVRVDDRTWKEVKE